MVKLAWNLGAWMLALYSTYLWATADPTAGYLMRDGLWVAVLALLLGGQSSATRTPLRPMRHHTIGVQLTASGHIVLWTGLICTLVGTLLGLLTQATPMLFGVAISSSVLWWIGLFLLLLATIWPQVWGNGAHFSAPTKGDGHDIRNDNANNIANDIANDIDTNRQVQPPAQKINWLSLFLVLTMGIGTRLLVLSRLPAFCVGVTCEMALQISEVSNTHSFPLFIAQFLYQVSEQTLLSIRLMTTLLALVGLLCFYLLTRRLMSNGSALLGTLLVCFSPWFHTLDATTLPALLIFFWSTVALWLLLVAWHSRQPRWALWAGVAFGWATTSSLLQVGLLFWLLLLVLLTLISPKVPPRIRSTQLLTVVLALSGFVVGALPIFLRQGGLTGLGSATLAVLPFEGTAWLVALFQHGLLTATQWAGIPPLTTFMGGATLIGIGYLLRSCREVLYGWLLSGLLTFGLLYVYTGNSEHLAEYTTLLFLLCAVTATIALHGLFVRIHQSWHPLIPLPNLVAGAALILVLLSAKPLLVLMGEGQSMRSGSQATLEQAMLTQVADLLEATPDLAIFAPASLAKNPAARLHLGDKRLAQIRPLADILNTLYTANELQPTAYLVPANTKPYNDLIQRLQPGVASEQHFDPATDEVLYTLLTVSVSDQIERQGLLGVAWESSADGGTNSQLLPSFGPLQLESNGISPLRPPFTLQWSGALRIATPGTYRISLEQDSVDEANNSTPRQAANISLQLDNRLIIDSVLGVTEQDVTLVKGFYQLTILYRNLGTTESETEGSGGDSALMPNPFSIHWQRPDGRTEIIPRNVLYDVPLQNSGLIGEYTHISSAQNSPYDMRKDLIVGLVGERSEPYRVQWRGQLAAPRTGEYLLAALSAPEGVTQLTLDGVQLFDTSHNGINSEGGDNGAQVDDEERTSAYAEGTIYLQRGWHDITVDYQPDRSAPAMQLFWQPPGSGPVPLDSNYLVPSLSALGESDRIIPSAPPLLSAADGSEQLSEQSSEQSNDDSPPNAFALSYGTEFWRPQTQMPPSALPTLPFEAVWQVGSCGTGDDQLLEPHGVAFSGLRKLLYVADTANQRVIEYTLDGRVSRIYSHPDWRQPFDLTLFDDGFPVLLDAETQTLYNLNPATGTVDRRPLSTGFYYPRGIAADVLGDLLIADTGGARIVRLTPGGEPRQSFGGPETKMGRGQPTDVVSAGGVLWAITAEDGRLWQVERGGSFTAIEPTNTINGPHLAGLPNGTLFLSDPARRHLLYLAATGEPLAQINLPSVVQPTGVAVAIIDDLLYLAVVDTANCQLSLWRTRIANLGRG